MDNQAVVGGVGNQIGETADNCPTIAEILGFKENVVGKTDYGINFTSFISKENIGKRCRIQNRKRRSKNLSR